MKSRFRILDANLNRAREGVRVLEDIARYSLSDFREASHLKTMRHRLDRMTRTLLPKLLEGRDAATDVGRGRDLPVGKQRSLEDIVCANARRAQEALRVMEEMGRGGMPWLTQGAHELRYDLYEIEGRLAPRAWRRSLLEGVFLYVLADPTVAPLTHAEESVDGGAQMLQLRHKDASARKLLKETRRLLCTGIPVIVNDRVDVAAEAAGVHVGETDLPIAEARAILGERKIIGATSHSLAEARRAIREGADYVSVGPMYTTALKPKLKPQGYRYLRAAKSLSVPAFCIGGITRDNIAQLVRRGGQRVAVCAGVLAASSPRAAARALRKKLG